MKLKIWKYFTIYNLCFLYTLAVSANKMTSLSNKNIKLEKNLNTNKNNIGIIKEKTMTDNLLDEKRYHYSKLFKLKKIKKKIFKPKTANSTNTHNEVSSKKPMVTNKSTKDLISSKVMIIRKNITLSKNPNNSLTKPQRQIKLIETVNTNAIEHNKLANAHANANANANVNVTNNAKQTAKPETCPSTNGMKSVGKIPQTQIWIPNPALDYLDEEARKKIEIDTKCKLFSGLSFMIEKANSYEKEIKLVKIYLHATPNRMKFYQSLDPSSEFHTILMDDFVKIGQQFQNTFCFDLVSSKPSSAITGGISDDTKHRRGSLTLCTLNLIDQQKWVSSLIKLKQCTIPEKTKLLADYSSINNSIELQKTHGGYDKNEMFYNINPNNKVYSEFEPVNQEIAMIHDPNNKVYSEFEPVNQEIAMIHDTINMQNRRAAEVKKVLEDKKRKKERELKNIKKFKDITQKLIESRDELEKDHHVSLLRQEHDKKTLMLLKNAHEQIKKIKVNFIINHMNIFFQFIEDFFI